jgi:hypothetical protein
MSDETERRGANGYEMSIHRTRQLDRYTAEALLSGVPAARRGAGRLGEHLAAAAAPGRPEELAGWPVVLAAFRAAHPQPVADQRRKPVIKTWLTKLLTVKAAAVLAVAATGGGVALAASSGTLPNPLADKPAVTPSTGHDTDRPGTAASHPGGKGPSALPSPSLVGLCHAYEAGAGADHGKALESPAFTALITEAGGKDKVDGYCKTLLATSPGNGSGPSAHPSGDSGDAGTQHPTGAPTEHPTGAPTSHPAH